MPSKRGMSQKATHCVIPFMRNKQANSQIESRLVNSREKWQVNNYCYRVSLWDDINGLELDNGSGC